MHDNHFLRERFLEIYRRYFSDIQLKNKVVLRFGRKTKTRLGSIMLNRKKESIVTINGLFRDPQVPVFMIDATLAHEFVHYLHGFSSEKEQLYSYPHRGGIVDRELKKRGLAEILLKQKIWLKEEWPKIIRNR